MPTCGALTLTSILSPGKDIRHLSALRTENFEVVIRRIVPVVLHGSLPFDSVSHTDRLHDDANFPVPPEKEEAPKLVSQLEGRASPWHLFDSLEDILFS
jgi:hypothetical protein